MKVPVLALVLFGAPVTAAVLAAQAQPRVDFRRDVQPIFREHCYACHGPEQQMNGLRLDRRADAMRGGSQSDIGPGNADGSRLYHRLIGTRFGQQMPPTGTLGAAQVAVIKSWIDQGAEWPDDLAGGMPAPPIDHEAEELTALVRNGDRTGIEEMLRRNPRVARTRAAGGSTALMFAAEYGDAGLMKKLIDAGAEPGAANSSGATALMWAVPDTDKMRLLLGSGVDADARSEDRRTALLIASGIVGSAPAVRLLLEYGASPWVPTPSDLSPLREAARVDNADVFRLLLDYGADPNTSGTPVDLLRTNCFRCAEALGVGGAGPLARVPPPDRGLRPALPESADPRARPVSLTAVNPMAIRAAVNRSLPLLQAVDLPFVQKTGCVSCHHNSLVTMAVTAARRNGYQVDEKAAKDQRDIIARYLESWRERTLQNIPIAGGNDTISYLLYKLFSIPGCPAPVGRMTKTSCRPLMSRPGASNPRSWLPRRLCRSGHRGRPARRRAERNRPCRRTAPRRDWCCARR
jgi:mono/diheme cytochrome c family protein